MVLSKHHQSFDCDLHKKSIKMFSKLKKLPNFLGYPKSMTNYLSFETNPKVLAWFVKEWQGVKYNYFWVEWRDKKQKNDEVRNHICSSKICSA